MFDIDDRLFERVVSSSMDFRRKMRSIQGVFSEFHKRKSCYNFILQILTPHNYIDNMRLNSVTKARYYVFSLSPPKEDRDPRVGYASRICTTVLLDASPAGWLAPKNIEPFGGFSLAPPPRQIALMLTSHTTLTFISF